jgi:hypothetical protein
MPTTRTIPILDTTEGVPIDGIEAYGVPSETTSGKDLLEIAKATGTYEEPTYEDNASRKITIEELAQIIVQNLGALVENGLSIEDGKIVLGGELTHEITTITGAAKALNIFGASNIAFNSSTDENSGTNLNLLPYQSTLSTYTSTQTSTINSGNGFIEIYTSNATNDEICTIQLYEDSTKIITQAGDTGDESNMTIEVKFDFITVESYINGDFAFQYKFGNDGHFETPYLKLTGVQSTDNSLTNVLVADNDGNVYYRDASSLGGSIPHATASGTDTYTATISGVTSYSDGDAYLIRFTNGNTSGATLNINALGAKTLYKNNDGVLIGGDIISGGEMICVYNSTTDGFQVIGTAPNTLIGYVTNADSVSLTKGMAVYAFGGQGDRMTVKRANNLGDSTSAQTVGLVLSATISAGQKGLIMMQGLLDGLSILPTSTFADGDPIYLGSTAGSITKTKPYAPNHLVYLGVVTTASNGSAGRMYVKVQNGYELDELHNVQAQSPTLKDTLWYDNSVSPAQWKTASIATILGYTPVASNAAITGATKTKITYDSKGLVTAGADIAASDLPSGIDATKIADGSVSNTEFQYLDGVTSAIQTQLNNKLNYYTLFIQSLSINPADGLTYFIGSVPATPNQTANNRLFKFSTAGTLNSFIFSLLQGTNGSAETVTVSIRNNTTTVETQLGTFTSDFGANISTVISFTGLSISVNTTDNYTIKIASPAWATNPTGWVIGGNLLVTI